MSCYRSKSNKTEDGYHNNTQDYAYIVSLRGNDILYDYDGRIVLLMEDSSDTSRIVFASLNDVPGKLQNIKDKIVSVYFVNESPKSIVSYHSGVIIDSTSITYYDDNLSFYKYDYRMGELENETIDTLDKIKSIHILLQRVQDLYLNLPSCEINGLNYITESLNRNAEIQIKEVVYQDSILDKKMYNRCLFFIETAKKQDKFFKREIKGHQNN